MGGACSSDRDGDTFSTVDSRSAQLTADEVHSIVLEKLKITLFSGLMSVEQLTEFARYFGVRHFLDHAVVVKAGSQIDTFYIVSEGQVRMEVFDPHSSSYVSSTSSPHQRHKALTGHRTHSRATSTSAIVSSSNVVPLSSSGSQNSRTLLCLKKPGEYFGEGFFSIYGGSQSAMKKSPTLLVTTHDLNVVTQDDAVQLLVLTKSSYMKYVEKYPEMVPVIRSITMSMEKQLQELDFFRDIEPMKMKMLVTMFKFVPLLDGGTLFREGDFDRENGNSLYFLYKGRVKVTNADRSSSAQSQPISAWSVPSTSSPTNGDDGIEPENGNGNANGNGNGNGSGSGNEDYGRSPSPTLPSLPSSPPVEEKVLNTLNAGSFVGEVSLLLDVPRTATITAVESSLLLELSQKNFRHFITIVPEILQKFNSLLLDYNIHLRYFIHNPLVLSYFIQHCKSEFSTENIDFVMAVREFRKLTPEKDTQDAIETRAREIEQLYIGARAEQQVNLKGSVEMAIIKGLKEKPIKKYGNMEGKHKKN